MPFVPRGEYKIVVRPRGGLLVGKVMMPELVRAVASAAKVNSEEIQRDTVCPNLAQNIIVISTPEQARVSQYASVRALGIGGQAYEVFAYAAAPETMVKGVIGGIPLSEMPEMIRANVVNDYNDTALEAHRIGTSHAVIVLLNVTTTRRNASPAANYAANRTPRARETANKFKTPFLLRKRERERKTATEKAGKTGQSKFRFSRKDDSPALPKSAQRERRNSRSENRETARRHERSANRNMRRSLSRDRAWTDVVKGSAKSETNTKTRQRSSPPARKPQNDPLTAKMLQLESIIKLMRESMRQQQETMRKQAEMITRLTSQQPRSGMQWRERINFIEELKLRD
ncbi:hypothetical protein HPB51_003705 [Rhipicephalus microplus]|uniref:Uncharacterized protein n=1 Tax=Rhipicephalus microplus TaxID=6941 RepID=A0A9J6E6N0_RHIMP|nr:hypothetical protein HPB51_003705 [Rhipicephalus microplus]